MVDWKNCINGTISQEKIQNITGYIQSTADVYKAPIDRFYVSVRKKLTFGANIQILEDNDFLGPLLYVGVISDTENYVREVFAECIRICPICRSESAKHNVSLGSVLWRKDNMIEKSVFENLSFSDGDVIKKELNKCLNIQLKEEDLLSVLLCEFDKLCEMRHAIVHSNCELAGINAIKLGIPTHTEKLIVKIKYAQLQECASICTAFVEALNLKLFETLATRWAIQWRKMDSWNISQENILFTEIWDVFSSSIARSDTDLTKITKIRCRNAIKKEFHVDS